MIVNQQQPKFWSVVTQRNHMTLKDFKYSTQVILFLMLCFHILFETYKKVKETHESKKVKPVWNDERVNGGRIYTLI